MHYRVDLSPRAVIDLDRIVGSTPSGAVPELLEQAILSLETMPERCGVERRLSSAKREVRQMLLLEGKLSHKIYFVVTEDVVNVVHIRHASRRPLKRL